MDVDSAVIQQHRRSAPAYDTYPGAEWFVEAFNASALDSMLTASSAMRTPRFAIDFRLPTPGPHWSSRGLAELPDLLRAEIEVYAARFENRPVVDELRLGWNDATPIRPDRLMRTLRHAFDIDPRAHLSVTVNPCSESAIGLRALRHEGFSRLEIDGTGHGSPWRSAELHTLWCVGVARELGFTSVGATFAYGMPGQCQRDLRQSVGALMHAVPTHIWLRNAPDSDRLRSIVERPRNDKSTIETVRLLITVVELLRDAGYECIGQDLYALPSDPLAVAHRQGRLLKKPHGLSLRAVSVVLGIGPGAMGATGNTYYQNHLHCDDYRAALARGELPVMRGTLLGAVDLARRAVIHGLTADMFVDITAIETAYQIDFRRVFKTEMAALEEIEQAGLLLFDDAMIELTQAGRLISSSIAMIFDQPLRDARSRLPFPGRL